MPDDVKDPSQRFKDVFILAGWILGILLIGGLLWFFTQNFRDTRMIRTINRVLINNQESRRLESRLSGGTRSGKNFQNYQRFSLAGSRGVAVVITVYPNSIPASCVALVNSSGVMDSLIPLDDHSVQAMGRIEKKSLDVYKRYIEENEKRIRGGE